MRTLKIVAPHYPEVYSYLLLLFYAGKLMKHYILLFILIIANSGHGMDLPDSESESDEKTESSTSSPPFSPESHGLLMKLFDSAHCHDYDDGEPYVKPAPSLPTIMPPKDQIKKRNRQNAQKLMERAQTMRAECTSLNSFIDFDWQQGATILTLASGHKCRQHIIEFAIDHGANPDLANKSGITPLKQAIESLCLSNVRYLIQKGATFCHDKTLLAKICSPFFDVVRTKATRKRVELLHLFLQYGADPNTTHLDPTIPHTPCLLSYLLCHFQFGIPLAKKYPQNYPIFIDQRKQMIMVLLQAGLNPLKKDEQGKTDWQKIVELKDEYDPKLFDFAEEQIQKGK